MNGARAVLVAAGDDQQKAAPLGLFVILLLGVACYFLFKSMSRHLKRVREDFPAGTATGPAATGPAATRPAATRPAATRPAATRPATTRPATASSAATRPDTTGVVVTEPTVSGSAPATKERPDDVAPVSDRNPQ